MKNQYTKIAIINHNKCKPKKCNHECRKGCPVQLQGNICIEIENIAKIYESQCIGCGRCVKRCPFNAIQIVRLPTEMKKDIIFSFGESKFRLYRTPIPKQGHIVGFIGQNGIGKSTILNILSGSKKPNMIQSIKGSEFKRYLDSMSKMKIVVKPQNVDKMIKQLRRKNSKINVAKFVKKFNKKSNKFHQKILKDLNILPIFKNKIVDLSGGEFQKLINAVTLMQTADVYIFDEPTNYLDIEYRLKLAQLIIKLKRSNSYIFIVEHDLSFLDYVSDYIHILYGQPSAYGTIATLSTTARAINNFFDGYISSDNIRFRSQSYNINKHLDIKIEREIDNELLNYDSTIVKYENFSLHVNSGSIPSSSIMVIMGKNGTGKTTFLKYLVKTLKLSISYKPQYIDIEKIKNLKVQDVMYKNIATVLSSKTFIDDIIEPFKIKDLYNKYVKNLSGGELQRVMITLTLGKEADIYLFDEPSASLDIEQRVMLTKILKKFITNSRKVAFIVEHDILMALSFCIDRDSKIIVFDQQIENSTRKSTASEPYQFNEGINRFLKILNITFRRDRKSGRPRINKLNSTKDREQKMNNKFFE